MEASFDFEQALRVAQKRDERRTLPQDRKNKLRRIIGLIVQHFERFLGMEFPQLAILAQTVPSHRVGRPRDYCAESQSE